MASLFNNITVQLLAIAYSGKIVAVFNFCEEISKTRHLFTSVDYANGSLFAVNGPEHRYVEIRGYTFDIESGKVTSKFGTFLDPHDIAVTHDAREV